MFSETQQGLCSEFIQSTQRKQPYSVVI